MSTLQTSIPTLISPQPHDHSVQFYDGEESLTRRVRQFLSEALRSDDAIVVVATPAHFDAFSEGRTNDELKRIQFVDADETLRTFMRGDRPDRQLFFNTGGAVLHHASGPDNSRRIRAFGEMVDLLCRAGNDEAAIALEEYWNELAMMYPLTLLCAYSMDNFYSESHRASFKRICDTHGRVHATESFDRTAGEEAREREIVLLQQQAAALRHEIDQRKEMERGLIASLMARRAAEEELRRMYDLLVKANSAKDRFIATLSHELRTPLTAILGWAHMLNSVPLDEGTTRLAHETIERSGRVQAALIDDLLDLSRITTGKLTFHFASVSLGELLEETVQTIALTAEAKEITLSLSIDAQPIAVNGDRTRLQQIVWNLLSNAVKFSCPGSLIRIVLEKAGDEARLVVADEGCGIDAALLPHVFDPFLQGADAEEGGTGLGLGLAIAKQITEMHGGRITASSEGVGLGATFELMLPLLAQPN